MIDPRGIQELLDKEPFKMFRVYMSDGHAYEVTNPARVVRMDSRLFIALPHDKWKFLSYTQITRIESIAPQSA
ncbi:MAG TPA: hypothetical protein VFE47_24520 [Tepidisphaeraceae bacterium]|jgi:hypothetical protein|nr:hypothetical protein [Tepidisphaeraceae bacterium]